MKNDKIEVLLNSLYEKTKKGEVIWNKGSGELEFKLVLAQGIAITVAIPMWNHPDHFACNLLNKDGVSLGTYHNDNPEQPFPIIEDLYNLIRDKYYKVEETIDDLINIIQSDKKIGTDEDDLPF